MLKAIFNFFKKPVAPVAPTPYKVEAPEANAKKPTVKKATTRTTKKALVVAKTAPRSKAPKKPKA